MSNPCEFSHIFTYLSTSTPATLIAANASLSYRDLLALTCLKIVRLAKPFACKDSSLSFRDLIALKEKVPVGQWRDSNDGLGGGRYPYDVNTALMPAALRAIGELARAHTFTGEANLDVDADQYAVAWEKHALQFFKVWILLPFQNSSVPVLKLTIARR